MRRAASDRVRLSATRALTADPLAPCEEVEVGAGVGLHDVVDVQALPAAARVGERRPPSPSLGVARGELLGRDAPRRCGRPRTSRLIQSPVCTRPSGPPAAASGVTCSTTVP